MNTFFDLTPIHLLLIANSLLVAAASIAIVRFQRLVKRSQQIRTEQVKSVVPEQDTARPAATPSQAVSIEKRVHALQKVVARLAEKERVRGQDSPARLPMDNAVRMARQGASITELTRSCGLSIGEARLMRRLHGTAALAANS